MRQDRLVSHVFSNPLLIRKRAGITEEIVHGMYYFDEPSVGSFGENFPVISSQLFMPLYLLALEFEIKDPEVLLFMAASSGKPHENNDLIERFAKSNDVFENELVCKREKANGNNVQSLSRFNNLYALHHVFLVAVCKRDNLPVSGYWEEKHPIQERIMSVVGKITSEPTAWCVDKNGLPTAITSAKTILRVWAEIEEAKLPIIDIFSKIFGKNSLKTRIGNKFEIDVMTAFLGRLIVLSNDNGTFLVRSLDSKKPFGLVLKFASNSDRHHVSFGILAALRNYPYDNALVNELKDYLESRVLGTLENGVEVSFN